MIAGSEPILAKALMRARGFKPALTPASLLPSNTAAAPSTMPDELPGVMDVVERFDLGIALDGDGIEARHFAHLHEGRLAAPRASASSVDGRMCSSLVENGQAVDVLDRHHRVLEAALLPGLGGALLAFDRVGVDVVAREAVLRVAIRSAEMPCGTK